MDSYTSSSNICPTHSKTIIHIDMDCFYAQVEEIKDPSLKNKPLGVQQKNIVVTSNYKARSYGITKLMLVDEAKKLCPDLILVPGEDLTPYRQMSAKIFEILHKFTPLVEKLGLDENFLDVTNIVSERLNGNFSDVVFEVKGCVYPPNFSLDDCSCGCAQRLCVGTHIAKEIRSELFRTLGITCCAGISYNKLLAKIVGNKNKPNNQTVLVSSKTEQFMRDLNNLMKITGIGQKTESLLLENGIANITDLQRCDLEVLKKKFGYEMAIKLKDLSFGRDNNSVRSTGKPKTISLEDSCRPISVTKDIEERFRLMLMRLVGQVSEDGRIPVALKITVRKFDPQKKTSHRETKQANILPTLFRILSDGQIMLADNGQEKLIKIIMRLFERVVDMKKSFNITLLGLAFSKFQERKHGVSPSIANYFIRKSDLEVQSITNLVNKGSLNEEIEPDFPQNLEKPLEAASTSNDSFQKRRSTTTASPIPMLLDVDSMSSDFSDISEAEVEPSPKKKRRLGLLIAKRRLSPPSESETSSPSKLRVSELRLNSRDSDKDSPISSPVASAVPIRMFSKMNQTSFFTNAIIPSSKQITRPNCNKSGSFNAAKPSHKETLSLDNYKMEQDFQLSNKQDQTQTHVESSLDEKVLVPPGVDPAVFKDLPQDLQKELIQNWSRNALDVSLMDNVPNAPINSRASKTNGANTLHRYFIRNK
ncbi:DNA polymerase iota [Condylostylus longicornis]|uniref:DNA polymerase iota n=1 Tax=Condylostylus longicornis TaxID=2530218 RepID=UPI00244DB3CB|nr:DNA polymerase iota [Condylostylus longicornis]